MMFSRCIAFASGILYLQVLLIASPADKTEWSVTLNDSSGMMESPGYPENYPNNVAFNWSIRLHKLTAIEFTVHNLSMEWSSHCKHDSLNIYQCDDSAALITLGHPMCGDRCFTLDDPACKIHAVGNAFLITFVSDSTVVGTGFRVFYNDHDTLVAEICNAMYTNMSNSGYIRSNGQTHLNETYPENTSCEWTIVSPPGFDLMFEVIHFDLTYSGPICLEDYLELTIKFRDHLIPVSTRYCGRRQYWRDGQHRKISELSIRFQSDSIHNDGGFELFYEYIITNVSTDYSEAFKTIRLTNDNREIAEPSLIDASCLLNSSYCQTRFLIETDIGHRVRMTLQNDLVTVTVLSQSLLQIYDGISINNGSEITENPRNKWGDFMFYSSGHFMLIVVHLRTDYLTHLEQLNVSFDAESIFLNIYTAIVSCTLSNARLSQVREPDSWELSFRGNKESPGRSSFCISKFDFDIKKSLQISTISYISQTSNVDGCSFEGIVLYVDDISESKKIGPLCELRGNFVKSVLNKLVLTGRKFYLYLYSYTVADTNSMDSLIEILIEETSCKGIQLTVHHLPIMTSTPNGSVDVLVEMDDAYHLFFSENNLFISDNCVVISIHNLLLDRPSKGLRIHSNQSFKTCFYSVIDRSPSEEYRTEVCEDGSLPGEFLWSLARIQKGEAIDTCPYSMTCTTSEPFQTDCGSIELLPKLGDIDSNKPCTWKIQLDRMEADKKHYFRIFIEIFQGLELQIDEFFESPCAFADLLQFTHKVVIRNFKIRNEYEHKTIGAYCSILSFKYNLHNNADVLIAHYSLEKYQLPKYNASEDAIYIKGKRYTRHPIQSNFELCNDQCKNLSSPGKLVSINTLEELEQLKLALGTVWR